VVSQGLWPAFAGLALLIAMTSCATSTDSGLEPADSVQPSSGGSSGSGTGGGTTSATGGNGSATGGAGGTATGGNDTVGGSGGLSSATGGSSGSGGSAGSVSGGSSGSGGTSGSGGSSGGGSAGTSAGTSSGGTSGTAPTCSGSDQNVPFVVSGVFVPSGWMGDNTELSIPGGVSCPTRSGGAAGTCYVYDYTAAGGPNGWAGVSWQYPEDNWGVAPGLCVDSGATKVVFQARGAAGGELVSFSAAGESSGTKTLTTAWQTFQISLAGVDYDATGTNGGVTEGFSWSMAAAGSKRIYIDDIRWVTD
jgi:hypothetical protein